MPRHRLVLILWLLVTISLVGAWGHSLLHLSTASYLDRAGQGVVVVVHPGEVNVLMGTFSAGSTQGWTWFSQSYPSLRSAGYSDLDEMRGPFGAFSWYVDDPPTALALPLWALILLMTLFFLPLFLHARSSLHAPPTPDH